jgi:hypothetical protein
MAHEIESEPGGITPANDNQGPDERVGETRQQLDQVVLTIARLIGRRIARDHFAALGAANDNRPSDAQDAEVEADED